MMYDIIPTKGEKYTVNSEHILCLKQSGRGCIRTKHTKTGKIRFKAEYIEPTTRRIVSKTLKSYDEAYEYLETHSSEDSVIEISVKEFLNLPNHVQKNWLKGYKTGVDFPSRPVDFDPYIIGFWLGDGSSSSTLITTQDSAVLGYLNSTLRSYDLMLNYYGKYDYKIRGFEKDKNKMLDVLKHHSLLDNKHIPSLYKINDRKTRLHVLAGIVDSDGYTYNNTIEISQKSKQLADDIQYIARSLGFQCTRKYREKSWSYKGEKKSGMYHVLHISGNIDEIPIRIERKKPTERTQKKNHLHTGIEVKCVGEGDYYGFTLDGNHRYLLGDFTVTHNTSLARNGIAKALKRPFQFFSLGGASDIAHYVGHSYTYEGSIWGRIIDSIMQAGCMNPVLYFDELDKVSSTPHGEEIISMLIHLTDRSQNMQYHDRYFAGVDFDLSQCLFVFSFNDESKVHPVLKDRMNVIQLSLIHI